MRGAVGDWTEGAGQTGRGGVEDGEMETAALTPAPAAAPTAVNTVINVGLCSNLYILSRCRFVG